MKKVVCITDQWVKDDPGQSIFPKKGEIYTVDDVDNGGCDPPYFILREIRSFASNGKRASFSHHGFREVDSSFGQYCEDIYLSIAQFEEAMKEVSI